jgi:hypothetical protein
MHLAAIMKPYGNSQTIYTFVVILRIAFLFFVDFVLKFSVT